MLIIRIIAGQAELMTGFGTSGLFKYSLVCQLHRILQHLIDAILFHIGAYGPFDFFGKYFHKSEVSIKKEFMDQYWIGKEE